MSGTERERVECELMAALAASPGPKGNRLLASLSDESLRALQPHLEQVPLPLGMVVYESGGAQGFVYFPTSSIVSLLYVLADGASAEIAVTGNEGLGASPSSWAAKPRRAARWCRARGKATGCAPRC